jgi:hypothetical protein
MSDFAGESRPQHGWLDFDRRVKDELRGSKIRWEAASFSFESLTTFWVFMIS